MSYSNKKWYKPTKLGTKLGIIALILLFIRIISNIPVPMINRDYLSFISNLGDQFIILNAFSGGAFRKMSFMTLGITPFITASIILQLLEVTFPKISEIKKGDTGQKRMLYIEIALSIVLSITQSIGLAMSLGKQGMLTSYTFQSVALITLLWTIGSTIMVLAGEYISKFCIGNGVSIILAFNIIADIPNDFYNFYTIYIKEQPIPKIILAVGILVLVIGFLVVATVILNNAHKEIPLVYPTNGENNSRKSMSSLPIKLNTAGVIPVIFASTIFAIPALFNNKVANFLQTFCSSTYWFNAQYWYRTIGFVVYFGLVVLFAYFYTAMMFKPMEIATRLKKRGACIPGIRPGQPTVDYLRNKVRWMTLIGACFLFILTQIPMFITHFSSIGTLSFGGTSIIIIVGVVQETIEVIKSENLSKVYQNSFTRRSKSYGKIKKRIQAN